MQEQSKTGALAGFGGINLLRDDSSIDRVVLNDFLVHLLQQIAAMQQVMSAHGLVPQGAADANAEALRAAVQNIRDTAGSVDDYDAGEGNMESDYLSNCIDNVMSSEPFQYCKGINLQSLLNKDNQI